MWKNDNNNLLTTKKVRSICFECFVTIRQGRHGHSILAVLTSVSLMRKWLKPGRLFFPYFRIDSWSTESPNMNVTTCCDGTVSRRPRIHHTYHWCAYSLCRIRYDCLKIAEHELTRCHDGLTKDYHGVSWWYFGRTMTFPFLSFRWGRDLADCRPAIRTVRLPSRSPGNWWSPLRFSAWTFNRIPFYYCYYNVVVGIRIKA